MKKEEALGIANNHAERMVDTTTVNKLIDKIYKDFDKQLKESYIKGCNDCHKALKDKEK